MSLKYILFITMVSALNVKIRYGEKLDTIYVLQS
jgi:hypothetical protein